MSPTRRPAGLPTELVEHHRGGMSRGELAQRVGIKANGGTFGTYLSTLRRNGLLEEVDGQLHASGVLSLDPAGPQ